MTLRIPVNGEDLYVLMLAVKTYLKLLKPEYKKDAYFVNLQHALIKVEKVFFRFYPRLKDQYEKDSAF